MALFAIEGLTFAYPGSEHPALANVSLTIEEGSFTFVLGRNGSGKSTLLRCLKPIIAPVGTRRGRILFRDEPLASLSPSEQSRRIGFVFQSARDQLVANTPLAEIAFGLESLGMERDAMRSRIAETCSSLGMADWLRSPLAELSSGQLQLVNLASVLVMEPEAIVIDEPFSGLDPIAQERLSSVLGRLNRILGITIIASGHALPADPGCVDEVIAIRAGAIEAHGTLTEAAGVLVKDDPAMLPALPAAARIFLGTRRPDRAATRSEEKPAPAAMPITVRDGRRWLARRMGRPDATADPRSGAACAPADSACPDDEASRALSIEDAWFRYAKGAPDVLRGTDLHIEGGRITALIGANGSGKTTLLRCACGLLRPYRGTVRLPAVPASHRRHGRPPACVMLPQDPRDAFSKDTLREELEEMASVACCPTTEFEGRLEAVVDRCRLADSLAKHPFDLSGGQSQRLGIAKALLSGSNLLLLDEPTRSLDAPSKHELAIVLRALTNEGCTVVLATHDLEFCAAHADAVSLVFDGQATHPVPPRTLLSENAHYTTDASRIARGLIPLACTVEDVIEHVEAASR